MEEIKSKGYGSEYDIYILKDKGSTHTPAGIFASYAGSKMYSTVKRLNVRTGPTVLCPIKTSVYDIVNNKRTEFNIGRTAVAVRKSDKQLTLWAECEITGDRFLTGWCCLTYLRPF